MALIVKNQYVASGVTGDIIGAAMEVHRRLGPGFLESVYDEALAVEFEHRAIEFERQKELPVRYRGNIIKRFFCDFLVAKQIVVEIKAIKELGKIDRIQVISYLKASGTEIGLLVNFGAKSLEYKRLIHTNKSDNNNQLNQHNQ